MARTPIPDPNVPFLNVDGTVSRPWFEFLLSLDFLRVQDIYDIAPGTSPANGNTIRYVAANKNWTFGA
jgi:hypothetical protein